MKEPRDEIRASYTSSVSFEMVWKTFLAWITRRDITHRNVLLTQNNKDDV